MDRMAAMEAFVRVVDIARLPEIKSVGTTQHGGRRSSRPAEIELCFRSQRLCACGLAWPERLLTFDDSAVT
jgi:hypothetical protein